MPNRPECVIVMEKGGTVFVGGDTFHYRHVLAGEDDKGFTWDRKSRRWSRPVREIHGGASTVARRLSSRGAKVLQVGSDEEWRQATETTVTVPLQVVADKVASILDRIRREVEGLFGNRVTASRIWSVEGLPRNRRSLVASLNELRGLGFRFLPPDAGNVTHIYLAQGVHNARPKATICEVFRRRLHRNANLGNDIVLWAVSGLPDRRSKIGQALEAQAPKHRFTYLPPPIRKPSYLLLNKAAELAIEIQREIAERISSALNQELDLDTTVALMPVARLRNALPAVAAASIQV